MSWDALTACLQEETLDPEKQSMGDTKEGYYIGELQLPTSSPVSLCYVRSLFLSSPHVSFSGLIVRPTSPGIPLASTFSDITASLPSQAFIVAGGRQGGVPG